MIPANYPVYARFEHDGPPRKHYSTKRVIAWDDDGGALVIPEKGSTLRRASSFTNFAGLYGDDTTGDATVALIPGGGWRIEHTNEDGSTWSDPLVAWALTEAGEIKPQETDCEGCVLEASGGRIYHPDETPPSTNQRT